MEKIHKDASICPYCRREVHRSPYFEDQESAARWRAGTIAIIVLILIVVASIAFIAPIVKTRRSSNNKTSVETHIKQGKAYTESGRYTDAIESYKQAIKIRSDDPQIHFDLGFAYGKVNRWEESAQSFKEAVRLHPNSARGHIGLGHAYSELNRYPEALESYRKALRLEPCNGLAHQELLILYMKRGDTESFREEVEIIGNLEPERLDKIFGWMAEEIALLPKEQRDQFRDILKDARHRQSNAEN